MACGKVPTPWGRGLLCGEASRRGFLAGLLAFFVALAVAAMPLQAHAEMTGDYDQLLDVLSATSAESELDGSIDEASVDAILAAADVEGQTFEEMTKAVDDEAAAQSSDIDAQSLTRLTFTVKQDSFVTIRLYQTYSSSKVGAMTAELVNSSGRVIDTWAIARYTTSRVYGSFSLPKDNYEIRVTHSYSQDIDGELVKTPIKSGQIECESNDSPAEANAKNSNEIWGSYYKAYADVLNKPVDLDHFKLTLDAPAQIRLTLATEGAGLCGLVDAEGNLLNKNNASNSNGGVAGAQASYYEKGVYIADVNCGTFPAGTYYIMTVAESSLARGSVYTIQVETKAVSTTKTYTVSFNSNGGSAVKAQTVKSGAKASKPANPTKGGYVFKGWYSDKGLTKAYNFSTAVKGNVTLYAKWAKQPAPTSFKDVPAGEWYTDWVTKAAKAGLMTGMKDDYGNYTGYFEPNRGITRAEVATVLWRIAGSPSSSASPMPDVRGHWSQQAVAWCVSQGIVTGYTSGPNAGRFCPDNQVTREELATMVYRFAKHSGVKVDNPPKKAFNSCGDTASVSSWSRDAMIWCSAAGVITGVQGGAKPMLAPQDGATRAMAAKIFVQAMNLASGQLAPYSEEEPEVAEQPAEAPAAVAGELDGLTYLTVPEGAVDAAGEAYVFDREYADLGGRYVGAGVYVTAYRGEAADLALPAQIEGADVVSADLSWGGDAQAGTPDPDGRTRLESLSLERGCRLASLDASGSDVAELRLAGDEALGGLPALRFLDLSGTRVSSLDPSFMPALERLALRGCPLGADSLEALTAWSGAKGLPADLEGAGAKDEPSEPEQPSEPATPDQPGAPAAPAEPEQPGNPAEPSEPAVPSEPEQPSEPSEPAVPSEPEQPSEPAAPASPDPEPAPVPDAAEGSESDVINVDQAEELVA